MNKTKGMVFERIPICVLPRYEGLKTDGYLAMRINKAYKEEK